MKSPCINVCLMDPDRGLCRGCLRTLDEIAAWGAMTESDQARVLKELVLRRERWLPAPAAGKEHP
ncbi:MAG TPA: DUF1289 domain-containing protein [Burkholderiales bacterium]|nr:DUF1289 domain-containing protein [Burkholderiales bacterium]